MKDAVGKTFLDPRYPEELAAKLQRQIQHVFESGEVVRDEVSLQALPFIFYLFVQERRPGDRTRGAWDSAASSRFACAEDDTEANDGLTPTLQQAVMAKATQLNIQRLATDVTTTRR